MDANRSNASSALQLALGDIQKDVDTHAESQRAFKAMYLCAMGSISDADAARLLLDVHGSEQAVKTWVEYHITLTNNVLRRWHMSARLEALESNQQKGKQE